MNINSKHNLITVAYIIAFSTSSLYFMQLVKNLSYPFSEIVAFLVICLILFYIVCFVFLNEELHQAQIDAQYAKLYCDKIYKTGEADNTKSEHISFFDTSDEFDEIMQSEPLSNDEQEKLTEEMENTKFVTLNLLSPLNGYAQYPLEVTDENIELITKWLNKETNSVYCLEVSKQGEAQHYYTTKELFEDLKTKFEA